ncbi:hypothetical protein YH62_24090 [Rhizobium sp. LC145]|nr:hypothetical protein YH62_24090 [Rhizobium sp. LC145]
MQGAERRRIDITCVARKRGFSSHADMEAGREYPRQAPWGYIIRSDNGNSLGLSDIDGYHATFEASQAAAWTVRPNFRGLFLRSDARIRYLL